MGFEEAFIMVFVPEITCRVSLLSENLCSKNDVCDILHYLEHVLKSEYESTWYDHRIRCHLGFQIYITNLNPQTLYKLSTLIVGRLCTLYKQKIG